MLKKLSIISFVALVPVLAFCQDQGNPFLTGGDIVAKPAWTQFKLPKKTMTLNYRGASPESVLAAFSKASGITIVNDPKMTSALTLYSPTAKSLSDAFAILNATLGTFGYELKKQDNLMVVSAKDQGGRGGGFNFQSLFGQGGPGGRNTPVLKYYPIQYASASSVAKTINDVYANQPAQPTFPFGGFRGGGRGGGMQIQVSGNPGTTQASGPSVHASADDFSNTVIVNAPDDVQSQISDMLKQIDKQTTDPFETDVYPLKYASSDDLATIVQNVLASNQPTGRGATNQNTDIASRFQAAARFGSSQAAFGTVVSEPRTNSIVVTATPENQKTVKDVVANLDKPIKFSDSAQVISLSNTDAANVAYVINQAFQSKIANTQMSTLKSYGATGNNTGTLNRFTNSGSTAQRPGTNGPSGLDIPADGGSGAQALALNNGQTTTTQADAGNLASSAAAADPELAAEQAMVQQAIGDPNIDPMALQTSIAVQGGFFNRMFGGGGPQSSQNQASQPLQAYGQNGTLTNVHNLNGNVTLIPDENSNSVIVVTNPDNMDIIKQIIDQLDRTPPQVMIQTIIVEATLDNTDKMGVEWSYLGGKLGTLAQNFGLQSSLSSATATTPPGGTYNITNGKLTAFLQAISQNTKFRVLEAPRIFTANNQQAEINVSQSIPYVVSSQVDVNGNYNYTYNFENVGVVLDVNPMILGNGMINLQVQQTANELQGYTSFNAPIVNQREANTSVAVKDGDTILLGGIMGDTKSATINKIPLLGDIPIIGNLFRSTVKQDVHTELLIFLSPHIITSPQDATDLRTRTENQMIPDDRKDLDRQIQRDRTTPTTPAPPKEGGH